MFTNTIKLDETSALDQRLWVVDVNASVTHGPFLYAEAVAFSERVLAVPEVTDVEVRPIVDGEVLVC